MGCYFAWWVWLGRRTIFLSPRPEHPRLYLRSRDLPDLRRRMSNPVTAPAWLELQRMAKEKTQIRLELTRCATCWTAMPNWAAAP